MIQLVVKKLFFSTYIYPIKRTYKSTDNMLLVNVTSHFKVQTSLLKECYIQYINNNEKYRM